LKRKIIIAITPLLALGIVVMLFIFLSKESLLTRSLDEIESISITLLRFRGHTGLDFEITLTERQDIEAIYYVIYTTEVTSRPRPNYHQRLAEDPSFIMYINYNNGDRDKIEVLGLSMFYRKLDLRGGGGQGYVFGSDVRMVDLFEEFFEKILGLPERVDEVVFLETLQQDNWGHQAIEIVNPASDLSLFLGQTVHTREEAISVAKALMESEVREDHELVSIMHSPSVNVWVFTYRWASILHGGGVFRIAFNGETGEVIEMWWE